MNSPLATVTGTVNKVRKAVDLGHIHEEALPECDAKPREVKQHCLEEQWINSLVRQTD